MNKSTKNVIILVVVILIGILIYYSPDESHHIENIQDAIKIGRTYAYNLLISDKYRLIEMSISPAKEKIDSLNLQSPLFNRVTYKERADIYDCLTKEKIPYDYIAPLTPILFAKEENEVDLKLMLFERYTTFAVMTFAYKTLNGVVEIPEKGKMLFSIATRYYKPEDDKLIGKLIRKIANLPLLNKITGRFGTTGKWMVFDYNYKYNLNDYLEWINEEGQDRLLKEWEESNELTNQLKIEQDWKKFMKSTNEYVEKSLVFLYEWGSIEVKKQIERIEKLYKAKEKFTEKG